MTIENTRTHVVSSIWKAIAQSGVDLSSIPKEQQNLLVDTIADNLLLTVDELLDEASQGQPQQVDTQLEKDERVLWEGRPFLSLTEAYTITSERVKIVRGLFGRDVDNFELIRIQDIDYSQRMSERMIGVGDVTIRGHDPSHPEVVLRNVKEPEKVYELLRRAWLEARKRYGLQFREEM